jgi:hypothetical protein
LISAGPTVSRFTLAQKASSIIAGGCCDALLKAFLQMEGPRDDRIREDILYYQAQCHRQEKEWSKAKESLLALKMLIDDASNPKYSEVVEELQQVEAALEKGKAAGRNQPQKTETEKRAFSGEKSYYGIGYFFILIAGSLLFYRWMKKTNRLEQYEPGKNADEEKKKAVTVIPDNDLTSLKEMCRNDGRVFFDEKERFPRRRTRPTSSARKSFQKVFKEIDKSPESCFDLRAARWGAQVLGLPTQFAALSYFIDYLI